MVSHDARESLKYRVIETLVEDDGGIVLRARDLRLDRDVALEVGPAASDEARAELENSVRALAALSHPNVVAVYEVAEVDGKLVVAREHVGGDDARAWAKGRTAREVIALYATAGEGLAAAHAAGIAHGAFRASSILVGADGRPKLARFARTHAADQMLRDQAAFCAALADALRDKPGVPAHVIAALERRGSSMAALVAELRRDPARTRRRVALAALGGVAVAGAIAFAMRSHEAPPCSDDAASIAPVWNAQRGTAIGAAFEAAGGSQVWSGLRPRLDAYADAWVTAHHAACVATRVDRTQSEDVLDRRMLCLERGRAQLASLADALAAGGKPAVQAAPGAVSLLPDLARCADLAALGQTIPADPDVRAKIATATRSIADARTALRWGAKNALAIADPLLVTANATGWAPTIAEAKLARGALLLDGEEVATGRAALEEAAQYALKNREDETAAYAMATLGKSFAENGDAENGQHWLSLASGLWRKTGEQPGLGDVIARGETNVALTQGKLDEALTHAKQGIERARKARGDSPDDHYNLANVLEHANDLDGAATEITAGLAQAEATLGANHPMLATYAYKACEIELYRQHVPEAIALGRRSLAIGEAWFGKDDVHLVDALEMLGLALGQANQSDEARALLDRGLAILHAHRPDSNELNVIENILADMEGRLGHWDAAEQHAALALARDEARFGKDSPFVAPGLLMLGIARRHRGNADSAAELLERAVAISTKTVGPTAPDSINITNELSYARIAQGRVKDAVELLAPSIAIVDKTDGMPPSFVAETHQAYADALWRAGGDHAVAREHATRARDLFGAQGPDLAQQTKDSEAWLASHR